MSDYEPDEIEQAFQHLWQVGPVGEDWTAQVDLYTDDCVYFDHHYGTMDPKEFGTWCNKLDERAVPRALHGLRMAQDRRRRRRRPHAEPAGTIRIRTDRAIWTSRASACTGTAATAGSPASATTGTWARPSRWAGPIARPANVTTRTIRRAARGCTGPRAPAWARPEPAEPLVAARQRAASPAASE